MTIEIITGAPGAGKTCFGVSVRLVEEQGRRIPVEQFDGSVVEVERRLIVGGIKGLVLEAERLPHVLTGDASSKADIDHWNQYDEKSDQPKFMRKPGEPPHDVPAMLQNWWLWCKPGDLIFVDEAQFVMARGSMGRKPPPFIQLLEVHRHYGVDFIFVTQHPGLLDTHIKHLCGMHRHVRSWLGSPLCVIYQWDHASNPERYSTSVRRGWRRKASAFRLYKSTVAVVKPPTAGRFALWAIPALLAAAFFGFRGEFQKLTGSSPPPASASTLVPGSPGAPGFPAAPPGGAPHSLTSAPALPVVRGCYAVGDRCECVGDGGRPVRLDPQTCRVSAAGFGGLVEWAPQTSRRIDAPDSSPTSSVQSGIPMGSPPIGPSNASANPPLLSAAVGVGQ